MRTSWIEFVVKTSNNDIIKIQRACFQDTHHLQTIQWFAHIRNCHILGQHAKDLHHCFCRKGQLRILSYDLFNLIYRLAQQI